jgi:hypothetical protein
MGQVETACSRQEPKAPPTPGGDGTRSGCHGDRLRQTCLGCHGTGYFRKVGLLALSRERLLQTCLGYHGTGNFR